MELKNEKLIELDKKIYGLNKMYGMVMHSVNSVPNLYAIKNIINSINKLKNDIAGIETDDEFEKIFIKNHLLNLENQRIYLQHASTWDKEKVDEIIEIFFGKDALNLILKNLKDFDYKSDWEFYLSYQNYSYRSYNSDSSDLQDRFRKILEELKIDILNYARKHHGLDEKYDFDLILGQPYSNRNFFSPSTRRVEISPNTFFAYKENDAININSSSVIQTIFHEFIGHALQEFNSSNLPLSMQDNSINTSVPTMSIHAEGVSQMMDEFSIEFMKQFKDKYNIKDEYIFQRECYLKRRNIQLFWNYYQYLRLKNMEKAFDYKKTFLKATDNFGALTNYEFSNESPFGFFKGTSYFIGLEKVRKIYNNLIKEFGSENEALINRSIKSGLLNIEVLEDFARYYIKRNLD